MVNPTNNFYSDSVDIVNLATEIGTPPTEPKKSSYLGSIIHLSRNIFTRQALQTVNPLIILAKSLRALNTFATKACLKIQSMFVQLIVLPYISDFDEETNEYAFYAATYQTLLLSHAQQDDLTVVRHLLQDISNQLIILKETIENLTFDYKVLPQIAQIDFEIEESQTFFKEQLMKYRQLTVDQEIVDALNFLTDQVLNIKNQLTHQVECNQPIIDNLLTNFPIFSEESPLFEWSQEIYQRCLCIYQKKAFISKANLSLYHQECYIRDLAIYQPKGIVNGGNNCYAIASLQALLANPFIQRKLESINIPEAPEKQDTQTEEDFQVKVQQYNEQLKKHKIALKLQQFNTHFFHEKAIPRNLHRLLIELRNLIFREAVHPSLIHGEERFQQDAADFTTVILDALGYSINTQITYSATDETSSVKPSTKTEPCQLLRLNINQTANQTTLQELIDAYCEENLTTDEDNAWKASTTENELALVPITSFNQTTEIIAETPPQFISLHLLRYGYKPNEGPFKIATPFTFDETVDLSKLFPSHSQQPHLYKVVSCVNHYGGNSTSSGHYTAFIQRENQWFECNDASVRPVMTAQVQQGKSYLYMLEKV